MAKKRLSRRSGRGRDVELVVTQLAVRRPKPVCVCCGDICEQEGHDHCLDCWNELAHGLMPDIGISDRQLESMACRVVRKGHEMS
jgi:hypothetical protein